jgi:glyoxylase-like metal-dependent hydrolase (beta-lactamase superfamily II)
MRPLIGLPSREHARRGALVTHVLLLESQDRLVLVDSGVGSADIADAGARLGRAWMAASRPELRPELTARHQLAHRGLDPERVTDIVLTHMDLDHCGGIADFPAARIHVSRRELAAAANAGWGRAARRYRPVQWSHAPRWVQYAGDPAAASWRAIPGSERLDIADVELHLVPLPGHSPGHCGVAVRTASGWLLHAGSALSIVAQLAEPASPVSRRYRWFERWIATSVRELAASVETLRTVARDPDVVIVSSHDARAFDACAASVEALAEV